MSLVTKMLPINLPEVTIAKEVARGRRATVRSLCQEADIECRVTGPSTERVIYLRPARELEASREPGPSGSVSIGMPGSKKKEQAILALGILAYAVFDYAARESMRGRPEARCSPSLGRPRKIHPLSGAERQRRWRGRAK
jgi:hypothetical protein